MLEQRVDRIVNGLRVCYLKYPVKAGVSRGVAALFVEDLLFVILLHE